MAQVEHELSRTAHRRSSAAQRARWLAWVIGAALVVGISIAALHFSEAQEIARIAERAQPWWLLLAFALQAGTYVAQGEIWRAIGHAVEFRLSRRTVFELSVAKLFVDQALPSAGLSGTAAVARYFEQLRMPRSGVVASVVVNLASYFATYVVLLLLGLLLLPLSGPARTAAAISTAAFIAGSAILVAFIFFVPQHASRFVRFSMRIRPLRRLADSLQQSDTALARQPRLLLQACGYQAAIVLLDAATIWVLIKALGATASGLAVFASFMVSNLFRTIGVLPGGLGTFEASSVVTLGLIGVPVPVALSATLLFRGLSFWLPMIPGLWLSRRLFRASHGDLDQDTDRADRAHRVE